MHKYRKKPVTVHAIQWDGQWITTSYINCSFSTVDGSDSLFIETLEGTMEAKVGDWIIMGVAGEYYPCKSEIFEQTYEKVED